MTISLNHSSKKSLKTNVNRALKDLPRFLVFPTDDAQLAEEGERDERIGAAHLEETCDLLQLAQVGLELSGDVI